MLHHKRKSRLYFKPLTFPNRHGDHESSQWRRSGQSGAQLPPFQASSIHATVSPLEHFAFFSMYSEIFEALRKEIHFFNSNRCSRYSCTLRFILLLLLRVATKTPKLGTVMHIYNLCPQRLRQENHQFETRLGRCVPTHIRILVGVVLSLFS